MRHGQSLSGNLLLCAASLAVCALVIEITVRVFNLAPEVTQVEVDTATAAFVSVADPILKYVPKAARGDINAYGIRDHQHTVEKPPGTYRIVVIGDSIAFGYCNPGSLLPIDRTFPKALERRLNGFGTRPGERFEVINLGVSGYDTRQEVRFLEQKGLAFGPDLVVVAYCLNDSWDASAELVELNRKQQSSLVLSSRLYRWLFHSSSLVRFVWQRVHVLRRDHLRVKKVRHEDGISKAEGRDGQPKSDLIRRYGAPDNRVDLGFDRLRELARTRNIDVVTVVFPFLEASAPYKYQSEHDDVRQKSAAHGFHHLDLLEAFRSYDFKVLQGPCSRLHPSEKGHAVAAEAIEQFIRRNVLPDHRSTSPAGPLRGWSAQHPEPGARCAAIFDWPTGPQSPSALDARRRVMVGQASGSADVP